MTGRRGLTNARDNLIFYASLVGLGHLIYWMARLAEHLP